MRGSRLEKKVEICVVNVANNTKGISTNAKKLKIFVNIFFIQKRPRQCPSGPFCENM
jgi:hypothetical protein